MKIRIGTRKVPKLSVSKLISIYGQYNPNEPSVFVDLGVRKKSLKNVTIYKTITINVFKLYVQIDHKQHVTVKETYGNVCL